MERTETDDYDWNAKYYSQVQHHGMTCLGDESEHDEGYDYRRRVPELQSTILSL